MGAFKQKLIDEEKQTPMATPPREFQAVKLIFEADDTLRRKALPHLDLERLEINWDEIYANDFGGGHWAALAWAKAIYRDQLSTMIDPFDRAFAMDQKLQVAVITALAMRWGLTAPMAKTANKFENKNDINYTQKWCL